MSAVLRALLVLIGVVGCLGGLAYAATGHGAAGSVPEDFTAGASASGASSAAKQPARPQISRHPAKTSLSTSAGFTFADRQRELRFQCRLDKLGWKACQGSIVFRNLAIGPHSFAVRALNRLGGRSRAARFSWSLVEPKSFAIELRSPGLGALYPGAAPVAVPVTLTNPNGAPIFVTGLRVAVTGGPADCDSAANLVLAPASASSAAPIKISARGSVNLPAPGVAAPSIQLRDLPVNQDACQGSQFSLAFSGEAHG